MILQKKYSGENEEDHIVGGYYFAPNASYTIGFPIQSVVSEIYEMQIGEFSIVEYDEDEDGFAEGSCIIYKQNPEELGYTKSYNKDFFTDFYADASYYQYNKMLNILGEDVVFTDKYNSIDTVAIPYNTTVIVKFDG